MAQFIFVFIITVLSAIIIYWIPGHDLSIIDNVTQLEHLEPGRAFLKGMRGSIYHELLFAYRRWGYLKILVYNDVVSKASDKFNLTEWDRLSLSALKSQLPGPPLSALRNGPRFWVLDEIRGYAKGELRLFNGKRFDMVGVLDVPIASILFREPYKPMTIKRMTDWIFYDGSKVYELHDTLTGEIYTMQAASLEINKNASLASLSTLRLRQKPKGWKYKVRTITGGHEVYHINGSATVLQDEFRNTYQKTFLKGGCTLRLPRSDKEKEKLASACSN